MGAGWWPEHAPDTPLEHGSGLGAEYVFPSGRAAIAQALERLELPRDAAIAVAGYSSDCLTRIVRRFGTPVEMCAAEANAAVLYEQWGWPFTDGAWAETTERFKGRPMVVDRVDSADFFARPVGGIEILSLSKLLGIAGGGLTRVQGCFQKFEPQPESAAMRQLCSRPVGTLARAGYQELFKESRQAVHPAALAWLQHNSVCRAAEQERAARQRHLQRLLSSALARYWPTWMCDAIGAGAGPVWAPILRGQDATTHWRAMSTLEKRFKLVSAVRPFNWSGSPLRPRYELSLALPVHRGVPDFDEIVAALE
jgi:hypothetical protein